MHEPQDLCTLLGVPLSDEQLEAITAPLKPGMVVAGAGTGKTTVMAARVVWLVGTGQVRPEEVLGLTFTRKAAGELGQRVAAALEQAGLATGAADEQVPTTGTYDSFAAQLVADHGLRAGLDEQPTLISGATCFRLMHQVVTRSVGPYPMLANYALATIIERARKLDSEMSSNLVAPDKVRRFTKQARQQFLDAPGYGKNKVKPYKSMVQAADRCTERLELLQIVEEYRALKHSLGVVEFSDQLATAAMLAMEVPTIAEIMREQYAVVLLDEYQDTSSAQTMLLTSLFAGHPVTAVGDPYQAIYGWRGAASSNMTEFHEKFQAATRSTLSINRRSHTRILAVGNLLAPKLSDEEGIKLCAPQDAKRGVVESFRYDTEEQELDGVVAQIVALEGTCDWSKIAVLCRRKKPLALLHQRLQQQGIPTEIVGLGGLLSLPEITPIVAMLSLLADPLDNPALATLLTGPRWALSLADMDRIGRHAAQLAASDEAICLLEAVEDPPSTLSPDGAARVRSFVELLTRLRRRASDPVADLVPQVVRALGVEEELRARGQDRSQLEAFLAACADRPVIAGDTSLAGLVAFLRSEASEGEGLERAVITEANSVKLATVHAAKGLEWEHVFLPMLNEGVFPTKLTSEHWVGQAERLPGPLRGDAHAIAQLEEYSNDALKTYAAELKQETGYAEDRLAYVAVTRARSHLVGSCHRWSTNLKGERKPSRYFLEIEREAAADDAAVDLATGCERPESDTSSAVAWPAVAEEEESQRQLQAASLVYSAPLGGDATEWVLRSGQLTDEERAQFDAWDSAAAHVLTSQRSRDVRMPQGLSATQLMLLRDDPQALAEQLIRRMPRKPSNAASVGTAFHEWVQRRFEMPSGFDEFERPPAVLQELVDAFERGQFATRTPLACEVPFSMVVGDFQVRGRMDAVYRWEGEFDELVVDWKTSDAPADELQLAVYRRAWAEARGLEPHRVGAAFYHVRSDRLVFPTASPDLVDAAINLNR